MAKLLLPLFFIFISLSSCSSDDDAVNEQNIDEQSIDEQNMDEQDPDEQNSDDENDDNSTITDPLVGEWKLLRTIETENVGEDGKENIAYDEGPVECEIMDLLIINSDNTGLDTIYSSSSTNETLECTLYGTSNIEKWIKNDDGTYTFSGNNIKEDLNADFTEGSFNNTLSIIFSDDLTTYSTTSSEDQTDLGRGTVTFENIYIRQ